MVWPFFIFGMIGYSIGEYASKKWSLTGDWRLAAILIVSYLAGTVAWMFIIKERCELARMGMTWTVLATLTTLVLGLGVFKETLTPLQWIGAGMAAVALVLLSTK